MLTLRRLARDLGGIAVVVGLLLLVTFLPPDTSLGEVEANRCHPRLRSDDLPAAGHRRSRAAGDRHRDPPGRCRLTSASSCCSAPATPSAATSTRATGPSTAPSARCSPAASSISTLTRSFLDTGPPYAETGWAIVAPAPLEDIDGLTLGALTIISGLDRIGLASYLRRHDVTVRVVRNGQELVDGIAGGELDGGVTEALLAGGLAADNDWWVASLPDELARYNLVFGLWKGDLTLKRKIVQAFRQLELRRHAGGHPRALRGGADGAGGSPRPVIPFHLPEDDRRQHGVGRAEKLADHARRHRHEQHGGEDPLCLP